jgi:hypothetical protein
MIQEAKRILKNTFGYDDFRLQQEAAIKQVLNKKDALVIMPPFRNTVRLIYSETIYTNIT